MGKSWSWHKRMGHMNFDNLVKINTKQAVRDMPKITNPSNTICKQCQHGKKTRVTFKEKEYITSKPLELVHIELCGPIRTQSIQGENYFMLLIDDYTRMTWDAFLINKHDEFEKFKPLKALVENETDMKIKVLISNNEGEFTSNEFEEFYGTHGIKRHYLAARTKQHVVVERKNRHTQDISQTMLNEARLLNNFRREEIYILNKGKIRVNSNKTPYEIWKGKLASIKYFRIYGRKCYIK